MNNINVPYSVYDFLGFIFPGSVVLGTIVHVSKLDFFLSPVGVMVFIPLGYITGHMIQSTGNLVQGCLKNTRFRLHPTNFLDEDSVYYSKYLKRKIKEAVLTYFNLDKDTPSDEIQRLCQSLLIQKGIGSKTETFVGIFGFYRGMIISGLILTILFLGRMVARIEFISSFLFFIIVVSSTILLYLRCRRFGRIFSDWVYRDFYCYYCGLKERNHA